MKMVADDKQHWDEYLDSCVYAYNTSKHESTKYTPFELMFGRKAVLPIELEVCKDSAEDCLEKYKKLPDLVTEDVDKLTTGRQAALHQAKENILIAQQRQKEAYDVKHAKPGAFEVGAMVLRKDFRRKKRKGGKMDPRWVGPYKIVESLGKGFYSVECLQDPSSHQRVCGVHLKVYHTPPSPSPDMTSEDDFMPKAKKGRFQLIYSDSDDDSQSPASPDDSIPPLPPPQPPLSSLKPSILHSSSHDGAEFPNIPQSPSHDGAEFPADPQSLPLDEAACGDVPEFLPLDEAACADGPLDITYTVLRSDPDPIISHRPQATSSPKKGHHVSLSSEPLQNKAAENLLFKWRQSKVPIALPMEVIDVDVDEHKPIADASKPKMDAVWVDNGVVRLRMSDKVILQGNEWLTSNIINAAQVMLQDQFEFKTGFQDTENGVMLTFSIETDEFIQILHNGHGHWLTITTIGTSHPGVLVYDSMYSSASSSLRRQVAALLATQESKIPLSFIDAQMQSGGGDCGLFAIAFATALCHGESPGRFVFNQAVMRRHLLKCFEEGKISMFPIKKIRRNKAKVKATEMISVYCTCRMTQLPKVTMIECSQCKNWFHADFCVEVPRDARLPHRKWLCSSCS